MLPNKIDPINDNDELYDAIADLIESLDDILESESKHLVQILNKKLVQSVKDLTKMIAYLKNLDENEVI